MLHLVCRNTTKDWGTDSSCLHTLVCSLIQVQILCGAQHMGITEGKLESPEVPNQRAMLIITRAPRTSHQTCSCRPMRASTPLGTCTLGITAASRAPDRCRHARATGTGTGTRTPCHHRSPAPKPGAACRPTASFAHPGGTRRLLKSGSAESPPTAHWCCMARPASG